MISLMKVGQFCQGTEFEDLHDLGICVDLPIVLRGS
jgi:hypothetical protein